MNNSNSFPIDKSHDHAHHHDCSEHHHPHDHHHEHGETQHRHEFSGKIPAGFQQKIYLVDNIDCANCAAKIEHKLNEIAEIYDATLTFATKQLKITAKNPDALLPAMRQIADSIEPGTTIMPRPEGKTAAVKQDARLIREKTFAIAEIVIGALLFIIGEFTNLVPDNYSLYLFIAAYLILGWKILKTAATNLFRGNVFDENFLMSIATLGAFAIKEYPEAVGVMLFYRIGEYFEERATERSRNQIMAAVDLRPETVNLIKNNTVETISAENAKTGDIILVRAGDRIPVDGTVIEGESRLDTSPVTGEPVPVKRCWALSLVGNLMSYALGLWLAYAVPGLF